MELADASEFAPAVCEFWQPNRIPYSPLHPRTRFTRWLPTDSEENYRRRGNKDFSVESVGYEFNSLGYRGPEFERRPGEAAVMFVGDSNTVGVGMPWEGMWTTRITQRLEERWGKPVRQCNLGWLGTGSDYAAMMVHQAVDVIRPDAVFVLWSFTSRITWFASPRRQVHFLPEQAEREDSREHSAYLRLASESQGFFNFVRNFTLVRERLLRQSIPFYWGTVEQFQRSMLEAYLPLDNYAGPLEKLDLARDARHAGSKSHAAFAERLIATLDRQAANGATSIPVPSSADLAAVHRGHSNVEVARRPDAASSAGNTGHLPRADLLSERWGAPVRNLLGAIRMRGRVRALKRKDPFIY
jgi:hypothetical protein